MNGQTGLYLGCLFGGGGGVDPKKFFGAKQRRETLFQVFWGVRGHTPPENFEKIAFRIG